MTLNVRQEKFCLEYAKSGNATQAYKLAGYKPKSDNEAAASATRLLRNAKTQTRLKELQQETKSHAIADATEIQGLLTEALRVSAQNGDTDGLCKTANILNKMQGAYVDKLSISVSGTLADVLGAVDR